MPRLGSIVPMVFVLRTNVDVIHTSRWHIHADMNTLTFFSFIFSDPSEWGSRRVRWIGLGCLVFDWETFAMWNKNMKLSRCFVFSSGSGSAQGKTWWKPPLTRWRKCEKKLRLPFLRLKSWKGCHSQSRWTFFLERFWMQKLAPRCEDVVILIIFVRR